MSPSCDSSLAVNAALPSLRGSAVRSGLGSAAGSNGWVGRSLIGGGCSERPASGPRVRERSGRCARGGCGKLRLAASPRCAAAARTAWRASSSDRGAVPFAGPPSPPAAERAIRGAGCRGDGRKNPAAVVCRSRIRLTRRRGVAVFPGTMQRSNSLHPTPPHLA
jgi:hypothetical protein